MSLGWIYLRSIELKIFLLAIHSTWDWFPILRARKFGILCCSGYMCQDRFDKIGAGIGIFVIGVLPKRKLFLFCSLPS
uniref:Candidate secreted effector n=1 Tax=Meloidogyne incognita TaxID=6306 RepID=A0A914M958_MELIC